MRSIIIIEVEHDDTTDAVQDFVQSPEFLDTPKRFGVFVRDYSVRVDVPECFTLDSGTEPHDPDICDGDVHVSWCEKN